MPDGEIPELTVANVQAAARTVCNARQILSPCYRIHEGVDHNVWVVGPNIILRALPATESAINESTALLEKDAAVKHLLRHRLRNPTLIAEVWSTIRIDQWICNIENRLHGSSLEVVRPTAATEDGISSVLHDLALIPLDDAIRIAGEPDRGPDMFLYVEEALISWSELNQHGYASDSTRRMVLVLKQRLARLNCLSTDGHSYPILTHRDLKGEHFMVDERHGTLKGVVDWSDAVVGDPARDIAGVAISVGSSMARRIGRRASHSDRTVARGILCAMCLTIRNLRDTLCGDDTAPPGLLRRQFQRAFEDSGVEDMLGIGLTDS